MREIKEQVRAKFIAHMEEQARASAPGQFAAGLPKVNWGKLFDRMDHAFDAALAGLAKFGPLVPGQVDEIVRLVAAAVSATDDFLNGPDAPEA